MMPYKGIYIKLFSMLLRKPLEEKCGKELTKRVLKSSPAVYREMLEKVDDIGADNPMAGNIYMGFVFLAIWKAADGAISVDSLRRVSKAFMNRPPVKKIMGKRNLNRPEDMKAMAERLYQMKAWADEHPQYQNKTWDFHFDEAKHQDGVCYHFTQCPLEKFARENGFLEALPVCCELDYLTAKARHGILHRDDTLAAGGSICDYWIVPDEIKNPK